jgi:hypothetical protein
MVANLLRFNNTLSKITLQNLNAPASFAVFGDALESNVDHKFQVRVAPVAIDCYKLTDSLTDPGD